MKRVTGMRTPLIRFFGIALSIILGLFLLISWLTFSKILSFESNLKSISEEAIPEIVLSGELYNEASKLLEFTDLLANANSDAAKRLAEQELNNYIRDIKGLSRKKLNDQYLEKQLETINIELLEFSDLIWQRAKVYKQLEAKRWETYAVFSELFNEYEQSANTKINTPENIKWLAEFPQLMITISQAVGSKRMQEVRGLFENVNTRINAIEATHPNRTNVTEKHQVIRKIKQLIFAKNGLEYLVITHLKLSGRVIGRENFMRHLIEDFSRLLEMTTNNIKNNIFEQIKVSALESKQQTKMIGVIIASAIMLIFAILIFIQQRILKRLKLFNLMVQNKTQGINSPYDIRGNDEISDLTLAFNEFAKTIEIQKEKLEQMSMTDGLTGVANRRALDLRLQHDIELSVRQKSSVVIFMIDIDFFKLYNDNYGHTAGDNALTAVASSLSSILQRECDFIARYGGEEFVGILPNTDLEGAQEIAKHIFEVIHELNIPHKFSPISDRITVSMGIAISAPSHVLMPEALINQADEALYNAKKKGKNAYKLYATDE